MWMFSNFSDFTIFSKLCHIVNISPILYIWIYLDLSRIMRIVCTPLKYFRTSRSKDRGIQRCECFRHFQILRYFQSSAISSIMHRFRTYGCLYISRIRRIVCTPLKYSRISRSKNRGFQRCQYFSKFSDFTIFSK